jgi:hypothetical protein
VLGFPPVEDLGFGVRRDPEDGGRRLEPDRPVKARLEIAGGPVHQDDRSALGDTEHAAKPFIEADDIAGLEPEWLSQGLPDE